MDKEKMIAETTKALESIAVLGWIGDRKVEELAVKLVDLKICKISEGSMMVAKEEYERLQSVEKDLQRYTAELYSRARKAEDRIKQAHKETAREILHTLWGWLYRKSLFKDDILELAEKYGVEVER